MLIYIIQLLFSWGELSEELVACIHVEDGGANLQFVHFSFVKHNIEKILGLLKMNSCTLDGVYKPNIIMSTFGALAMMYILGRKFPAFVPDSTVPQYCEIRNKYWTFLPLPLSPCRGLVPSCAWNTKSQSILSKKTLLFIDSQWDSKDFLEGKDYLDVVVGS